MHSSYPALVAGILWTETGSMTSMDRETRRRPSGVAWAPAARWACRVARRRLRGRLMRRLSRSRRSREWDGVAARPSGLFKLPTPPVVPCSHCRFSTTGPVAVSNGGRRRLSCGPLTGSRPNSGFAGTYASSCAGDSGGTRNATVDVAGAISDTATGPFAVTGSVTFGGVSTIPLTGSGTSQGFAITFSGKFTRVGG